jgi:hypothetical protein
MAQQSAEQGQLLTMVEWADILENGVGVTADPAKARNMLARELTVVFQTEHSNFTCRLRGLSVPDSKHLWTSTRRQGKE